jgi:geranylgeranyl pyrophosphate synthase
VIQGKKSSLKKTVRARAASVPSPFSSRSAVGKPIGSDLLNGLVTLPAIYYAEAHPEDEDKLSLPGGGWKDTERVQRIADNIRRNTAVETAMDEARQAVSRALGAL